ncbi:MAG: hypothetical protein LBU81_07385 [Methanosarcinales archaeon]|jgi:hypothetical protein|nr:hypothetical protein [Methanosarcinales archaeon]
MVPYDRLRLIEQRIHEISTTQDGIVREIVDIKTMLNALSKETEKQHRPEIHSAPDLKIVKNDYSVPAPEPAAETASDFFGSSYTPYLPADTRRAAQPPGFGGELPGRAAQAAPAAFNSRKSDGWEYQEFIPSKKNNAEPEKFIPAKTIPAKDDPFYFADSREEILDVTPLTEPEPPKQPSFENVPLTIQKIKPEEKEIPDRAEYIIGSNKKQTRAEKENEDYNAGCEYIIAEKDIGSRKLGGRRGGKPPSERKERVISSDEEDTEIITYE